MSLFRKKKLPLSLKSNPQHLVPSSQAWKSSPQAVETALVWLSLETTRNVLGILGNESPARIGTINVLNSQVVSEARQLGREEGWRMAMDLMISLAIPINQQIHMEETFVDQ